MILLQLFLRGKETLDENLSEIVDKLEEIINSSAQEIGKLRIIKKSLEDISS